MVTRTTLRLVGFFGGNRKSHLINLRTFGCYAQARRSSVIRPVTDRLLPRRRVRLSYADTIEKPDIFEKFVNENGFRI